MLRPSANATEWLSSGEIREGGGGLCDGTHQEAVASVAGSDVTGTCKGTLLKESSRVACQVMGARDTVRHDWATGRNSVHGVRTGTESSRQFTARARFLVV